MLRQRRLIPPARGHHPDRPPAPGPHQESQEIQRLTVRPVHILHHQPHPGRRPAGHRGQHLRHPGEQPLPAPLPVPASRARPAALAHPRQQPRHFFPHVPRGGVQCRRQQPAAVQPGQLTQRIPHRQQWQHARQRQALPPHHHHPRRPQPGPSPRPRTGSCPHPASPTTSTSRASPPSAPSSRDNSPSRPTKPAGPAMFTAHQPEPLGSTPRGFSPGSLGLGQDSGLREEEQDRGCRLTPGALIKFTIPVIRVHMLTIEVTFNL